MENIETTFENLIITGASEGYAPSLLGLLGSLTLNWPDHPPLLVYDLGMSESSLSELRRNGINVRKVPPFCHHWRQHYTWKIWCWNDAPAENVFWLDAGLVVLKPLDEVFEAIRKIGYFVVPNYYPLLEEASAAACEGCNVDETFRLGKGTLAGNVIGFRKQGKMSAILKEALTVASTERYIAATDPKHRHDQALFSLLLYKHLEQVVMADGVAYAGWLSPNQAPGQKIWAHRRKLQAKDLAHFSAHISVGGDPHVPEPLPPPELTKSRRQRLGDLSVRDIKQLFNIKRLGRTKSPAVIEQYINDGLRD